LVPLHHSAFLFFAAFLAGTINSVAGGGSFISFPALLFTGIPPIAANATNTVAVWPGTLASTVAYRNAFTPEARRLLPPLIGLGILGGILGAHVLLHTPQATFVRLIPWLLLGATLLFLFSGRITAWVRKRTGKDSVAAPGDSSASQPARARIPVSLVVLGLLFELGIAMYIGYFGAGAGILFLSLLAILGLENIHAMNGMKTLLVSIVNGVAIVTFIVARVIVWPQAIVMIFGAATGGYAGAHFAQKVNPEYIRRFIIVVGFAMSIYFFVRR
ncbi:MAG: sulfite exporter TauE/SafE family protein, partial [Candidatus Acidiferrales bacterium]